MVFVLFKVEQRLRVRVVCSKHVAAAFQLDPEFGCTNRFHRCTRFDSDQIHRPLAVMHFQKGQ